MVLVDKHCRHSIKKNYLHGKKSTALKYCRKCNKIITNKIIEKNRKEKNKKAKRSSS